MFKRTRMLISAGVNVGLIAAMAAAAKLVPAIFPLFYTDVSRKINHFLAGISALLPFPLWELLLAGLVIWQLVSLVCSIVKKYFLDWLCRLPLILTTLAFLFVAIWGLNFFGPDAGKAVGIEAGEYTKSELKQALGYYAEQARIWAEQAPRDADGEILLPEEKELSDGAVAAVSRLAEDYPRFADPAPRVKYLLGSEAFGYMGVTGIYVCFTGESAVSSAAYSAAIPFTMCHELGHSLCFCAEDEANFVGYLACSVSDDPLFRYSGYYDAFIYCYNSLYALDPAAATPYWDAAGALVARDCGAANTHYDKYEGAVQEAAQSVNDAYLHSFDQEGTESYDLVTTYLIAWYLHNESVGG